MTSTAAMNLATATTRQTRRIKLHSQQGIVFRARKRYRYRVAASGRRWGKTTEGNAELTVGGGERPAKYWYIAPELKQARDIAWAPLIANIPRSWLARPPNESRLEITLINGSVIALKGADDPDSLRGRGLGGVVLDEYADMKPAIWDEIIQPSLLDTDGWALFLGTPKGFDHFYDLYQQGQNAAFPEWGSWQFRTADAPHIKKDELAKLRRQYEQRGQLRLFLQEFEASFESNAGYILGALWKPSHTVTLEDAQLLAAGCRVGDILPWHVLDNPRWRPPSSALIYGSVDYGFGAPWSAHLHASLVGGHTRTFYEWYAREVQDYEQARRMRASIEQLVAGGMQKPEWIVMDPSMWSSRKEMGLAKSIAEVYEDELGKPLNITLMPGAAGRPARISRPQRWMAALDLAPDGLPWHSITTACPDMIRTVPRVPWDKDDPEVEDDDSENHAYEDGGRYFEARPHVPKKADDDPYEHLDPVSRAHHKALDKRFSAGKSGRLHPTSFAQ